ncbi:iron ABC transporter permease [Clostridium sp. HBUAS56010]|uniref:FecCD family ABC transporter permease n=1 Tax=Clostridium sp. HBUAS56010 TaxID=2571127 RepID=UPI001178682D|nr:iron ABC transporter permease [Clostridium sp. HBUAS56010]
MNHHMSEAYIENQKSRRVFGLLLAGMVCLLLVSIVISMSFGSMKIAPSHTYGILLEKLFGIRLDESLTGRISEVNIIWEIRFPRVLLGAAVGAGLSLCGMAMQAAVQNPLAEPYILGISSGASLGATFSIMLGIGSLSWISINGSSFWGFAGALGAAFCVLMLASAGSKMTSSKLVLSGTVVNALCNALSNFIIFMAVDAQGMQSVKFWTMGSLAGAKWKNIPFPVILTFLCVLIFLSQYRTLNALLLGDEAAVTLGIPVARYRRVYMVLSSLLTGVLVAYCGIIGFVGLIIPHITRAVAGADHRRMTPLCAVGGAIFMIWADTFARIAVKNSELPIGIVTALIGAPFFVYILIRKSYNFREG